MACGCRIAAHSNRFNRSVLQDEADYFSEINEIAAIINTPKDDSIIDRWKKMNLDKIRSLYNQEKIISAYEQLMLNACGETTRIIRPSVVEPV